MSLRRTSAPQHSASVHSTGVRSAGVHSASVSPLHSASVLVSEYSYLANPVPAAGRQASAENDEQRIGEDYLSPMKLRELSGESDLSKVTYLEICVNSETSSLGNFGSSLPALSELRCVESRVPCVRDLGTGLTQLMVLWLAHCGLTDLDGLPSLSSLQELYISHNEVSDVSIVAMLSSLQVLDLESNQVSEEDQLGYLGMCTELSSLCLAGNPLADTITHQQGGEAGYRASVLRAVPQLRVLDDILVALSVPLSPCEGSDQPVKTEDLRDTVSPLPLRPQTASPGRAGRVSPMEDDSSGLTHGLSQVICGNPVRGLKARRSCGLSSQNSVSPSLSSSSAAAVQSASLDVLTEKLSSTSLILHSEPLSLPSSSVCRRPHSAADFRQCRYRRPSPDRYYAPITPPPPLSSHNNHT